MTRSKRKPIANEHVRKLAILADDGRTVALKGAWDAIIEQDRVYVETIQGFVPRFIRRQQGRWRRQRRAEDRKLKRELTNEGRFA